MLTHKKLTTLLVTEGRGACTAIRSKCISIHALIVIGFQSNKLQVFLHKYKDDKFKIHKYKNDTEVPEQIQY